MGQSDVFHTLFVAWRDGDGELAEADLERVTFAASGLRGLARGLAFTPISVQGDHPFARDSRGPQLALELDFDSADDLDAALSAEGPLAEILSHDALPSLSGAGAAHQRMIGRRFAVPDPVLGLASGERPCTLLVEYPGATADLEAWLDHYDAHHPPIMARFPGIREIATFRPAPSERALPCARATSMQRNKVVFDSAAALVAALTSPVMVEMRADLAGFPPFSGPPTHHPMATRRIA